MAEAKAQSALAGIALPGHHGADDIHGVRLRERRGLALWLLRGRAGDANFASGVQAATGLDLPRKTNATQRSGDDALLCLGPDEWLYSGSGGAARARSLTACCAAFTDVSHGRSVLRLDGPRARDLLAKGLPLDLHPKSFHPGGCAQSVIARIGVTLHQIDDAPSYDLYVMRSYARSLWGFLREGALEFGLRVEQGQD